MKENSCMIRFYCTEKKPKSCVYFVKSEEHTDCKFVDCGWCNSAVAQVNRMTRELDNQLENREVK